MGDVAHRALNPLADAAESLAGVAYNQADQRPYREKHQGQLPVGVEHEAKQTNNGEAFTQGNGNGVGCRFGNLFHVEGQLGNQSARSVVVKIPGRQGHQPVEHVITQGVDDVAANVADEVLTEEGTHTPQCKHADNQAGQLHPVFVGRIFNGDHHILSGGRHTGRRRRIDNVAQYCQRKRQPERLHIAQQAFVGGPASSGRRSQQLWLWIHHGLSASRSGYAQLGKPQAAGLIHGAYYVLVTGSGICRDDKRQAAVALSQFPDTPLKGLATVIDQRPVIQDVLAFGVDHHIYLAHLGRSCRLTTGLRQLHFQVTLPGKGGGHHKEYQQQENHIDQWRQVYPDFLTSLALELHGVQAPSTSISRSP